MMLNKSQESTNTKLQTGWPSRIFIFSALSSNSFTADKSSSFAFSSTLGPISSSLSLSSGFCLISDDFKSSSGIAGPMTCPGGKTGPITFSLTVLDGNLLSFLLDLYFILLLSDELLVSESELWCFLFRFFSEECFTSVSLELELLFFLNFFLDLYFDRSPLELESESESVECRVFLLRSGGTSGPYSSFAIVFKPEKEDHFYCIHSFTNLLKQII